MKKRVLCLLLILLLLCGCQSSKPGSTDTTAAPDNVISYTGPSILTVHFIDVGQADSILLECNGQFALVDAGYPDSSDIVMEYMEKVGAESLELMVATHPHGDHMGGLAYILQEYPVEELWCSEIPYTNEMINYFLKNVAAAELQLKKPKPGHSMQLGGATISVIGPVRTNYEDINDISLVLMVELGDTRFLLTGDMELAAETDLLDSGADVKADVLKVGHHGSYSSTGYRLLREVAPTYAVISCGRNNEYGHPHEEPMSRLMDAEVTIFRTDKHYDVVAVSDGTNIFFSWGNAYAQPWKPAA